MLGSDEMRAWYGPDHVRMAADRGAIGTLLISDELFRYEIFLQKSPPILLPVGTGQAIRKKGRNMWLLSRKCKKRAEKCYDSPACTNPGNVGLLYHLSLGCD